MSEKKAAVQTFVMLYGRYSRLENEEKIVYQPGDTIELSEQESSFIRDKIMSVSEFEERVKAHEKSEAFAKEAKEILKPPVAPRDPEALERAAWIKRMTKPGRIEIG